jgi:hypothetical protein
MCQQTYNVCMSLMVLAIDIKEIDQEGEIELERRIKVYEGLFGKLMYNEEGTFATIKKHFGLWTNVSRMTPTKWDKHMRTCFVREQKYQRRKEEAKA